MTDIISPNDAALERLRPLFGGSLNAAQLAGVSRLWQLSEGLGAAARAYLLATVFHETAQTMQPIREWGRGKGRAYGVVDHSGKAPYGRGYVQITWRDNYLRADRALGLKGRLATDYDLALDPDIAAKILRQGMEQGWFTGKKLSDYLQGDQASLASYAEARRIINGRDRAAAIAAYAVVFEAALRVSAPRQAVVVPKSAAKSGLAARLMQVLATLRRKVEG